MTTRSSGGTLYPSLTELTGVTPHDLGVVSLDSQYSTSSHYPKEVTTTRASAASSRINSNNGDNSDGGVRSQRSSLSGSLHDPTMRSGSGHSQDSNGLDRKHQAHHAATGAPRQRTSSGSYYDDALSVVSSTVLRDVEAPRPQRQAPRQMSALDRLAQFESSVSRVKSATQSSASIGPGGLTRSQSAWINRSMPKPPPESSPPELERATTQQEFKSIAPRQPGRSLSMTGPRGSTASRRAVPAAPRSSGVEELHRRIAGTSTSSSTTTTTIPTPERSIPRNNSGSDLRHSRNHPAGTNLNSSVRPVRRTMSLPRHISHPEGGGGIASLGETFDENLQQEKFQQAIKNLHSASGGNRPHPARSQQEQAVQPQGSNVRVLHNPVVPVDSKFRLPGKLLGPDSFHARQEELQAERELERARSMREFTAVPRVMSRRGKKSEILASSRTPSPPPPEEPASTMPLQADDSDLRRSATKPKRASSLGAVLGFGGRRHKKEVSRHLSEPGSIASSGRGKRTVPSAPTSAEY